MFKEMANLASLVRQAKQVGGKMQEITASLKSKRVTGTAGGGMIEVEANGLGEILRIKIDPMLVEKGEKEMIEDLTPAAINDAITRSKQLHLEAMQSITSGFSLPGMGDAISQLMGGQFEDDDIGGDIAEGRETKKESQNELPEEDDHDESPPAR